MMFDSSSSSAPGSLPRSIDRSESDASGEKIPSRDASDDESTRRSDAATDDEIYEDLRDDNRVVMRHQIALNLDSFRATSRESTATPKREYLSLREETPPFASVIIPNLNGLQHLRVLLAALSKQTFANYEAILVDDASTDESVKWVEAEYPEVRILINHRNLGFVASCNQGADAARGRVLVFLNNDTEPEPGWLAAIAHSVCHNPDVAIFASKILLFDERDVFHTSGDTLGRDGIPRNRGVWQRDRGQYDELTEVFGGSGGGVAYRKEVWHALGGFDTDFWMYLEDVDFAFRAQLLGWRAIFVPEARMYHHLSATAGGELASYYVGRNTMWNIAKNMPRSLLMRNLLTIVGAQARITADAARNARGAAARARLQGQLAGILGLKRQLAKRKVIQARRLIKNDDLARLLVD